MRCTKCLLVIHERGKGFLCFNSYKSSISSPFLMSYHSIQPIPWLPCKFKDLMWQSKYYKSNLYACKRFTLSSAPKIYNQCPNLPNYPFKVPWQVRDESYPSFPSPHVLKWPLKVSTSSFTSSLSMWIGLRPFTFNVFPTCLNTIKHLQRLVFLLNFLALHKIRFTLN